MSEVAKEQILSRRLFRNEKSNWQDVEKLTKEILVLAEVVEGLANDLVKAETRMKVLLLKAYEAAPKKDCLFYDSPVSPGKQTLYLRMHLKKAGWDGVRDILTDAFAIPTFTKQIKDACRWLLKFNDDKANN